MIPRNNIKFPEIFLFVISRTCQDILHIISYPNLTKMFYNLLKRLPKIINQTTYACTDLVLEFLLLPSLTKEKLFIMKSLLPVIGNYIHLISISTWHPRIGIQGGFHLTLTLKNLSNDVSFLYYCPIRNKHLNMIIHSIWHLDSGTNCLLEVYLCLC